jgi:mannose-6-phosphate isomerase class I
VPRVEFCGDGVNKSRLIDESITPCFAVNRITLEGGEYIPSVKDSFAVYIVTSGDGCIVGDGYYRSIRRGDYFFMPYSAMGNYKISGNTELIECY